MGSELKNRWTASTSAASSRGPQVEKPKAPKRKRPSSDDDIDFDDAPETGAKDDTLDAGDDTWSPDDDSDLGLGSAESEEVGLDTDMGLDDTSDADLGLDEGNEGERWTTDSEDSGDLADEDDDLISEKEYGWTGDDDGPVEDDTFESDLGDEVPETADDGGVEGLDDDTDLDDFDVSILPKLEADADDDADGLGHEAFDELGAAVLTDEPVIEVAPGQLWKRLPERSLRRHDVWSTSAAVATDAQPSAVSVACLEHDGHVWVAFSRDGHVALARDVDAGFESITLDAAAQDIALSGSENGPLLWVATTEGVLLVSRDLGKSFDKIKLEGRALRVAGDAARQVAVVLGSKHPEREATVRIARSTDGGRRFVNGVPTALTETEVLHFAACRDAVLLTSTNQVSFAVGSADLTEAISGARGAATLVDEDGEIVCYAAVPQGERTFLVRRVLRDAQPKPMVIAELDAKLGAPLALSGYFSESLVTLFSSHAHTLVRIEASLDGEVLA